jgi:hypothetical protein
MKSISLLFISIFLLSSTAIAQSDAAAKEPVGKSHGTKVGIGVAISTGRISRASSGGLSTILPASLRVPINIEYLKLEPEFGLYTLSDPNEQDLQFALTEVSNLRVGLGVYYYTSFSSDASAYLGPKLGIIKNQVTATSSGFVENDVSTFIQKSERTDIFLALVIGGEYFLSSRFSVGAELGFEYVDLGVLASTTTINSNQGTQQTSTGSELMTQSALIARFHF